MLFPSSRVSYVSYPKFGAGSTLLSPAYSLQKHAYWLAEIEREIAVQFGLFSMNCFVCSTPQVAVKIAQLAEAAGFESLWAGEHVVLPDPQVPPSPAAPDDRFLDPVITLTYLAAFTRRVLLGTGVLILPEHHPLVLAKALASLDELSGGRLIVGIGAGYLEPEFRALGVPLAERETHR